MGLLLVVDDRSVPGSPLLRFPAADEGVALACRLRSGPVVAVELAAAEGLERERLTRRSFRWTYCTRSAVPCDELANVAAGGREMRKSQRP
jgi:hypothetical protein